MGYINKEKLKFLVCDLILTIGHGICYIRVQQYSLQKCLDVAYVCHIFSVVYRNNLEWFSVTKVITVYEAIKVSF